MAKYRRYVRNNTDRFQPHQFALMGLGIISFLQISSLYISSQFYQFEMFIKFIPAFISFTILLTLPQFLFVILILATYFNREKVKEIELPQMNSDQTKLAIKIKKLFTPKQIIDVLNLANSTRYGYEMPNIEVWLNESLTSGSIYIENIGNFQVLDKDKFHQKLSGILNGEFQNFSVISSNLVKGDNYMNYHFEDTVNSNRFIVTPGKFKEFVSENPHQIKLSKDLIWNTDLTPHLSCIARTRSGKSILMGGYISEIMVKQGWYVEYHSVKIDKYVKKFNGCFLPESIVKRAEYWCDQMDKRLKIISTNNKDSYLEMKNMKIIGVFFDEIGNLNAQLEGNRELKKRWESSINRLTATGGSCGIHIIAISQFGTKEAFLPSTARANCSDAVIMLGSAADSAIERQYLMPGFAEMPTRNYGIGEGLARFNSSGDKWMSPHHFEAPWLDED